MKLTTSKTWSCSSLKYYVLSFEFAVSQGPHFSPLEPKLFSLAHPGPDVTAA